MSIDYCEEAVDYLISNPKIIGHKGVGVAGISKGGELALCMAAFLEQKVGAAAIMNSVYNCGLTPATYKGKTVVDGKKITF